MIALISIRFHGIHHELLVFCLTGSRAVVMECQHGPRRKGLHSPKLGVNKVHKGSFKQTCPARYKYNKMLIEYSGSAGNNKTMLKENGFLL